MSQQTCGYRRSQIEDGVAYIAEPFARALVMGDRIDEILDIHRRGEVSVTTVLEYSAKRGRGKITQALVAEGITVTRDAILAAAKLGGTGVDLLLAGLQGESLRMARQDALHARLLYAHYQRAQDLLDAGVRPNAACYNALEWGAKRQGDDDWLFRCHPMLDSMIPATALEELSDDALAVILRAGRPIHIERTLEILGRPSHALFATAMQHNAKGAIETLRCVGLRMTDEAFRAITADLCRGGIAARMNIDPLFELYVQDSGQTMTAAVAEPILLALLQDREWTLRRINGPNNQSYQRARDLLLPIMRCMDWKQHLKLFDTIDRWATSHAGTHIIPAPVTAVLKHTIQAAHRVAMDQLSHELPPPEACIENRRL